MDSVQRNPIIPIVSEYDPDDVQYIDHTLKLRDNEGREEISRMKVPIIGNGSNDEAFLTFLYKFGRARRCFEWTDGPTLFRKFEMSLEGIFQKQWTKFLDENQDADRDEDFFDLCVANLVNERYEHDACSDMIDYLRSIRKPRSLTAKMLLSRIEEIIEAIQQLPNAPDPVVSEEELKRIYLKAFPIAWQENFLHSGRSAGTATLTGIRQYMTLQESHDPPRNRNNTGNTPTSSGNGRNGRRNTNRGRGGNRSQGNNNNNAGGRANNDSRGRSGGRNINSNNRPNNNGQGNSDRRRIQDSDPCPLPGHAGHTWGRCHQNANNPDRPTRNPTTQRPNRDAHVTERTQRTQPSSNNSSGNPQSSYAVERRTVRFENPPSDAFFLTDLADSPEVEQAEPVPIDPLDNIEPELLDAPAETQENFSLFTENEFQVSQGTIFGPLTNTSDPDPTDLIPHVLALALNIGGIESRFQLVSLFDTGSSVVLIKSSAVPKQAQIDHAEEGLFSTAAGVYRSADTINLRTVSFPEFSASRRFNKFKCYIFDNDACPYDLIIGRNILSQAGFTFDFQKNQTTWFDVSVPFHPKGYYDLKRRASLTEDFNTARTAALDAYVNAPSVKDAIYDVHDPDIVAEAQTHLSPSQREQLRELFRERRELFSGRIGRYPHRKFHIDLIEGAEPYHCQRPYRIPQADIPKYRKEFERQVELGLLERVYDTEWGFPGFIRPKKDGTIRTIEDFRELNKRIKRTRFLIPEIRDILERSRKYNFLTKIDISMCYYTLELDEESKKYCVIVTPFGKYRRTVLPQGLKPCADWTQATMIEVFHDMWPHDIEIFFDDLCIMDTNWDDHLRKVSEVCRRLESNGFTVNPLKCQWGVKETDFLGFWLTPDGYKPWAKKIEPFLALSEPKTLKQLRAFIGFVNFYKPFWRRRAHIMNPLTTITGIPRKDFAKHWGQSQSSAFVQVKQLIAEQILLQWPDLNKPFDIETDASDYQLGAVIKQDNVPVAFFSRKLTQAQRNYTTIEKELLSIVEVLAEFRSLLKGGEIRIYTDHRNLTFTRLNNTRVLHWRTLIEEFAPTFFYRPGPDNLEADFLSRYPRQSPTGAGPMLSSTFEPGYNAEQDALLFDNYLNFPDNDDPFPLNFANIREHQSEDEIVRDYLANEPERFELQAFGDQRLVSRRDRNGQWKIVLPHALADQAIDWYHSLTGHGGITRVKESMSAYFWFPNLHDAVEAFIKTCDACQRYKSPGRIHGEAPARLELSDPWSEVAVDLIGPWKVLVDGRMLSVYALTSIDMATTLSEIIRIEDKTSEHIAMKFEQSWLARYPRPLKVIHDRGGEFVGGPFQSLLHRTGIRPAIITTKNPQANAVCERLHATIKNQLRTIFHANPPNDIGGALDIVDLVLSSAMHASRTAVHRTLKVAPGALAFHRDMLLPIPILADFNLIRQRRQTLIDDNARRENQSRIVSHDYTVGDEILLRVDRPDALAPRAEGPYTIVQVHANGTVTFERMPNVYERINIRRIRPYHRA